jgi:hypothetical protein
MDAWHEVGMGTMYRAPTAGSYRMVARWNELRWGVGFGVYCRDLMGKI